MIWRGSSPQNDLMFDEFCRDSVDSFKNTSKTPWFKALVSKDGYQLAYYLHNNHFRYATERDSAGWTPICYAAMKGDVTLVKTLLKHRANVNDCLTKKKQDLKETTSKQQAKKNAVKTWQKLRCGSDWWLEFI